MLNSKIQLYLLECRRWEIVGAGRRREWGVTASKNRVSFGDYKNIIKLIVVMVAGSLLLPLLVHSCHLSDKRLTFKEKKKKKTSYSLFTVLEQPRCPFTLFYKVFISIMFVTFIHLLSVIHSLLWMGNISLYE